MAAKLEKIQERLAAFDFAGLFTKVLFWNPKTAKPELLTIKADKFTLAPIAQMSGMVVFVCTPQAGALFPDYNLRRKVEKEVTKIAFEHIIIYIDTNKTQQIWQWVRRVAGRPSAYREVSYKHDQSGLALAQKLAVLKLDDTDFDPDGEISIVEMSRRVSQSMDVDRVTKKFYDRFKKEHDVFMKFIKNIPDEDHARWYASVMLNRLMFIYFIQKKGFLDSNLNYLRDKLNATQAKDSDLFYRYFLRPLFFNGFARPKSSRTAEDKKLLGEIPYLNGGLFWPHVTETTHDNIQIVDAAFEKVFAFFDEYQWHLDDRSLQAGNEINPDVLGYIFEKYINQRQMGAYYTKEDITEYIGKNTIIPYLFDAAKKACRIAFEGEAFLWRLLSEDPDRYIYDAVKKGVKLDLPPDIEAGRKDVSLRGGWNKPALPEYALPTEIWREVVARRERYTEIRAKLANGEIRDINDLITYNLDIRRFAQDVIEQCEGPSLLRAFWGAIKSVSVLDPTCGSGAFLFAALNILEPLYEACLTRMEAFIDDLERSGEKHSPQKYSDFRKVLEDAVTHHNRLYFIYKSIIVNNLYGVDIMKEATEICKLRLFLKLVAQVDKVEDIEPLPDIDFNIRSGNSLVGYATQTEIDALMSTGLDLFGEKERIKEKAEDIARMFRLFRNNQMKDDSTEADHATKNEIERSLKVLGDELSQVLAQKYCIDPDNRIKYETWLRSHVPFHWVIEFYDILSCGGFDVIIGNPPYLETKEIFYDTFDYSSRDSGAVHAMCIERSLKLLKRCGCASMILPMALVSTQRMVVVQKLINANRTVWYANYAWRPGKLFDTVNRALTIFCCSGTKGEQNVYSTSYQKWNSSSREYIMQNMNYTETPEIANVFWIPKLGFNIERNILGKVLSINNKLVNYISRHGARIYYRTTGGLYWKVFTSFSPKFRVNGVGGHSSREASISIRDSENILPLLGALSSSLYWWWYTITSNLRDLNPSDIKSFPIPDSIINDSVLRCLSARYIEDLQLNSTMAIRNQKQTGQTETQSFKIQKSKHIIDEIDHVLAKHYNFTDEELDFIINYDIKYRMGIGGSGDQDEEGDD